MKGNVEKFAVLFTTPDSGLWWLHPQRSRRGGGGRGGKSWGFASLSRADGFHDAVKAEGYLARMRLLSKLGRFVVLHGLAVFCVCVCVCAYLTVCKNLQSEEGLRNCADAHANQSWSDFCCANFPLLSLSFLTSSRSSLACCILYTQT